jgi:hypothetical protein
MKVTGHISAYVIKVDYYYSLCTSILALFSGWNDIRYDDSEARVQSPNIANLARKGRTLRNHYVQPGSIR